MKKSKNDIQNLLSARLRPTRKGPSAPHLRLVKDEQARQVEMTTPEIINKDEQEIAAANAIAAMSALCDSDFAARVGSLTRMDALAASQNRNNSSR